jgi:hypothetical protein
MPGWGSSKAWRSRSSTRYWRCRSPVAILAFLTLREPPRGMSDAPGSAAAAARSPLSMTEVLKLLLSKPSVRRLLAGCALAAISMNGIGQFFAQFIVRNYHVGFAEAGRVLSFVAGGAMPCGMLLGGFGVDWAARRDRRWYTWGRFRDGAASCARRDVAPLPLGKPSLLAGLTDPAPGSRDALRHPTTAHRPLTAKTSQDS